MDQKHTEKAIKFVEPLLKGNSGELYLSRSPLPSCPQGSGLNDELNGTERPRLLKS